jgi:hypothetical protein
MFLFGWTIPPFEAFFAWNRSLFVQSFDDLSLKMQHARFLLAAAALIGTVTESLALKHEGQRLAFRTQCQ